MPNAQICSSHATRKQSRVPIPGHDFRETNQQQIPPIYIFQCTRETILDVVRCRACDAICWTDCDARNPGEYVGRERFSHMWPSHSRELLCVGVSLWPVSEVRIHRVNSGGNEMCKVSFGLVGNLKAQLQERHRSKPCGTADENVIGGITGLECVVTLA